MVPPIGPAAEMSQHLPTHLILRIIETRVQSDFDDMRPRAYLQNDPTFVNAANRFHFSALILSNLSHLYHKRVREIVTKEIKATQSHHSKATAALDTEDVQVRLTRGKKEELYELCRTIDGSKMVLKELRKVEKRLEKDKRKLETVRRRTNK